MAASATFALKSGEWFRRVRFVIFAPDSHAQPCALSGRNSTYRTDRNCGATSFFSAKIKEIEEVSAEVPDHLLGIDAKKVASFRDIFTKAREAINEIREFESRGFVADKSVRGRGFDTLG